MITIRTQTSDLSRAWSRRDALRLGLGGLAAWQGLGGAASWLAAPSRLTSAWADDTRMSHGKAKACILIYLYGGPSHLDIWDLKPAAPAEIRGEFSPISTRVPGMQITEHLPKMAERADRLAIVRSLTHDSGSHGSAAHYMLTGHAAAKHGEIAPTPSDYPHPGAVLQKQIGKAALAPGFVALPWKITTQINEIPGQGAGLLGQEFNPLQISYDDLHGERFLLDSPGKLATVLQLERESDATRDRYGRNIFGQSLLLARRLVEAGARFVTVYWPDRKDERALHYNGKRQPVSVPMWDTHGTKVGDTANFPSLKNRLLPPLDLASSALIDDLLANGHWEETLLVWTGEFGRTPRIQGDGRGHYNKCFSSMLSGGGIQGGAVYGASDPHGAAPAQDPVSPGDFLATIYHQLGIPAKTKLPNGKPLFNGQPISSLVS